MTSRSAQLVGIVTRAAAILRAQRCKADLRVRMHPLDIAMLGRDQAPKGSTTKRVLSVAGINVEPDCAVVRGRPEVEYRSAAYP